MLFFEYAFDPLYSDTIWLYTALFLVVSGLAFHSRHVSPLTGTIQVRKGPLVASFLIAWFFYVFNDIGADLKAYLNVFENATLKGSWVSSEGMETGYRFINAWLHTFIENKYVGVGVIKTVQLLLVYISLYMFRDDIDMGYGIMAYMALFYLQSFNLIRITLAASIAFFCIALLYKGKNKIAFLLSLLTPTIHSSAYGFVMVMVLYIIYTKMKPFKSSIRTLFVIAIPVLLATGGSLISKALSTGIFMERYEDYVAASTSTAGVMQIIYYLPLFIMLYNLFRSPIKERGNLCDISFIFTLSGFVIAMLGYSVGMLARMATYFIAPFMVTIPYYIRNQKEIRGAFLNIKFSPSLLKGTVIVYWIFRFIMETSGQFMAAQISEFKFLF